MSEVRLFTGDQPPAAAANMVWTEVQPGSRKWVELPEEFVSAPVAPQEPQDEFTMALEQVKKARSEMPLWVWPGIPLALAGFKLARFLFGGRRRKRASE